MKKRGNVVRFSAALGFVLTCLAPFGVSAEPFRAASPGTPVILPRDHGSHPEFETEWWYYTGQLVPDGADLFTAARRFGFQLTFFRRAMRSSAGEIQQTYLAHAAFTDVKSGRFIADHRLASGALGLAGADRGALDVWNLDWRAEMIGERHVVSFGVPANQPEVEIRLIGEPAPVLLNGEGGFSRKGSCPSCASMYYSIPRIPLGGHIEREGGREPVHGFGWMDHEYMTNALEKDHVGWDWLSLMFADGTNVMVFRIRDTTGRGAVMSGSVMRNGVSTALGSGDFTLEPVGERWRSPTSGGEYPLSFRVSIPRFGIDTTVTSLVPNQEVPGEGDRGIAYYEGAVRSGDNGVVGYLEMTGYARPLNGAL